MIKKLLGILTFALCFGIVMSQPSVTPLSELPRERDVLPPGLFAFILVDDGGTMGAPGKSSPTNSASFTGVGSSTGGRFTDSQLQRWAEARRIVEILQADTTAKHQVAVLRFEGNVNNPLRWVSELGGDRVVASDNGERVRELVATINSQKGDGERPANLEAAMNGVYELARGWAANNSQSPYQPVVIVLTDDVPFKNISTSPWQGELAAWRTEYNALKQNTLSTENLRSVRHTPPLPLCRFNDGYMTAFVYAMGTANWINADGTRPFDGTGTLFEELAKEKGWLGIVDSAPLVARIDPRYNANYPGPMRLDMFEATHTLMKQLRCLDGDILQASAGNVSNRTPYNVPVYAINRQVTLMLQLPSGMTYELYDAGGNRVDDTTAGVTFLPYADHTLIRLERDAFSNLATAWQGGWRIELIGSGLESARVAYLADVAGIADLSWELLSNPTYTIGGGDSVVFALTIRKQDGSVVRLAPNADLVNNIAFYREDATGASVSMSLTQTVGGYEVDFRSETRAVALSVYPALELGSTVARRMPLSTRTYRLEGQDFSIIEGIGIDAIDNRRNWSDECTSGGGAVVARASISTGNFDRLSNNEKNSLNQYVNAFLEYGGTRYPLVWSGQGSLFETRILCEQLAAGSDQRASFRLVDGEGKLIADSEHRFEFSPTLTPTPTSTPVLTPTPVFTPTPSPASSLSDGNSGGGALAISSEIVSLGLGSFASLLAFRVIRSFWFTRPLRRVYLRGTRNPDWWDILRNSYRGDLFHLEIDGRDSIKMVFNKNASLNGKRYRQGETAVLADISGTGNQNYTIRPDDMPDSEVRLVITRRVNARPTRA
jgi:hypothetical protein